MENETNWAHLYLQRKNTINGRDIYFYLIQTAIGNICAVEYENTYKELKRKLFDEHYEQAETYFDNVCRKILNGKL